MSAENEPVSGGVAPRLEDLMDGVPIAKFNELFGRLVADIADFNKEATGTRKLTLTLTLKPNNARAGFMVGYDINPTFGKEKKPDPVYCQIDFLDEVPVARERNYEQKTLMEAE